MPFKNGHKINEGRHTLGSGLRIKKKYLAKWEEVFDSKDARKKLEELFEQDFPEFIRLGLAAMPKEIEGDISLNFEGKAMKDLLFFAQHGTWLEEQL